MVTMTKSACHYNKSVFKFMTFKHVSGDADAFP